MSPPLTYDALLDTIAARLGDRALSVVLIDGVPACGKSSLSVALERRLRGAGRDVVVVENDWFMAPTIRSPRQIMLGLGLALSGRPVEEVERGLLDRFLDGDRLTSFQDELERAAARLAAGESATLNPRGAYWNLARAPEWTPRSFPLRPGAVVVIEGTLSRAVYLRRFPEALCVFVEVPLPDARERFLRRNRTPASQRNLAFSMLAWFGPAYRLAADMIGRDRHTCHLRVDLSDLNAPRLV